MRSIDNFQMLTKRWTFWRVSAVLAMIAPLLLFASWASEGRAQARVVIDSKAKLGSVLFGDRNLSISRAQSCVSCHSPNLAFTDPRTLGAVNGAVSRGADRHSFGDRNAPTLLYAALTPRFSLDADGRPHGGFFHDGRATTLEEQAGKPLLDPTEMAMPDVAAIAERLRENPAYLEAFPRLFGAGVLDDPVRSYSAIEQSLAAFNRTPDFSPFDSRYDRFVKGEIQLTPRENDGRALFFSEAGCAACHSSGNARGETFSNYGYFNLGVPPNRVVRVENGSKPGRVDLGVRMIRTDLDPSHDGKFKVPTLRNVTITGPYMHNGVFEDLRTAILFHGRLSSPATGPHQNPETGKPWDEAEVPLTIDRDALTRTPALTDGELDALIAFLGTLTDRRFEYLLAKE